MTIYIINYYNIIQIQYLLLICIYFLEKIYNKYIFSDDILLKKFICINYDNIHTLYILYIAFNIEIHTIITNEDRHIYIYFNNNKISNIFIKNEKLINNNISKILSLEFLDNLNFIHLLEIYNCGIIIHTNHLFQHIYNYLGERRTNYNLICI